ncbi:rho GTPase-activating protein 20-like [Centruroides vittatus]|uniref:rho GTPase-activating protein 20-like n=1 Tax=Centruroides vittatus TaxID=120091 RepID=UPI00351038AE
MTVLKTKIMTLMKKRKECNSSFNSNKLEFGVSLVKLMEFGSVLPVSLKEILKKLHAEAHQTVHVFGVTPPVSIYRPLQQNISNGNRIKWKKVGIHAVAAIFKYFLRSLPHSLLQPDYYHEWINVEINLTSPSVYSHVKRLINQLPESHRILLNHLLTILCRICQSAPVTLSTPIIVGYFIGPYVLWNPELGFCSFPSRGVHLQLAKIVKYLIIHMDSLFQNTFIEQIFPMDIKSNDEPLNQRNFHYSNFVYRTSNRNVRKIENDRASTLLTSVNMNDRGVNTLNLSIETSNSDITQSVRDAQRKKKSKSITSLKWSIHPELHPFDLDKDNESQNQSRRTFEERNRYDKAVEWCLRRQLMEEKISLPSWIYQFENWKMDSDELPSWILNSNFTMNMNDLTKITEMKSDLLREFIFETEQKKHLGKCQRVYSNLDYLRKIIDELYIK